MSAEKFEQWAVVELFGHARIAGRVTEQTLGGCAFVRVDVPAVAGNAPFTKLYGQGAIYAMSFVDRNVALAVAERLREKPIDIYSLADISPEALQKRLEFADSYDDCGPDDDTPP